MAAPAQLEGLLSGARASRVVGPVRAKWVIEGTGQLVSAPVSLDRPNQPSEATWRLGIGRASDSQHTTNWTSNWIYRLEADTWPLSAYNS